MRAWADGGARPQPGKRPDLRARFDRHALEMAESADLHIIADGNAGGENDERANDDISAEARIIAEEHRRRIDQRGPGGHRARAAPPAPLARPAPTRPRELIPISSVARPSTTPQASPSRRASATMSVR